MTRVVVATQDNRNANNDAASRQLQLTNDKVRNNQRGERIDKTSGALGTNQKSSGTTRNVTKVKDNKDRSNNKRNNTGNCDGNCKNTEKLEKKRRTDQQEQQQLQQQ